MTMLPPHAVFHFPWELNCLGEGKSVRTFGRLSCYEADTSRATLSCQHASKEHHVFVRTSFVEPFNPIIGAQYLVLGETETYEESHRGAKELLQRERAHRRWRGTTCRSNLIRIFTPPVTQTAL
ncbi:CST complex subunit TEN1 isoform X2 [Oryzias latipes]|uniref:CST complex subunit TEN1 isoform X2 n=1 Tax=Oryzias latipes TaxID=8090 RepID=UPI0009D9DC02|nr:CST complex subunit TEN1 isoform X2 [Oryzias latipes]